MYRQKNKIAVSKSSNTRIGANAETRKNKKSRSNAEIQPAMLKKRGVYVEKKATNVSINAQEPEQKTVEKTPVIPRPGKKGFLNSVLSILSKSSTGTQYPECDSQVPRSRYEIVKHNYKSSNTKKKYKSKILNEQMENYDRFVILQSKKDIVNTPSIESCLKDSFKWSDILPPLIKRTDSHVELVKKDYSEVIAKEIMDGLQMNTKTNHEAPQTSDTGLYNFFVDLLETTFSVYNVQQTFNDVPSDVSSNVALEMDEAVVKKLQFTPDVVDDEEVAEKQSQHYCCTPDNGFSIADSDSVIYESVKTRTKPMRSEFTRLSPKNDIPKAKKRNKRELLNILKTELSVNVAKYEEPRTLFDALKVMARNKRKTEKVRFDRPKKPKNGPPTECFLKRRKILSFNTKITRPRSPQQSIRSLNRSEKRFSKENQDSSLSSTHSLEVCGFDYETEVRRPINQVKEIIMTYHSSPSPSENDIDLNDLLISQSQGISTSDFI